MCSKGGFKAEMKSKEVVASFLPVQNQYLPLSNLDLLLSPVDVNVFFCYSKLAGDAVSKFPTVLHLLVWLFLRRLSRRLWSTAMLLPVRDCHELLLCNSRGADFYDAFSDFKLRELNFYNPDESIEGELVPGKKHGVLSVQVEKVCQEATLVVGATIDAMDVGSPYYLHFEEIPSLVLVSILLDGTNYSRAMKMPFYPKTSLDLFTVLEKTEARYTAWEWANNIVLSWLLHSVASVIAQGVLWLDTARDFWDDLKERFYEGDVFRIADIQVEIYTIKQRDPSVSQNFTKFKLLWNELLNLRPLPIFVYTPKCHCGCLVKIKEYYQMEQVTTFLRGLNENYVSVKSQIMLMLQQQERQNFHGSLEASLVHGEDATQSAFLARRT